MYLFFIQTKFLSYDFTNTIIPSKHKHILVKKPAEMSSKSRFQNSEILFNVLIPIYAFSAFLFKELHIVMWFLEHFPYFIY